MTKDWTELSEHYRGQWVALADDEVTVVGNGRTLRAALDKALHNGYQKPIMLKVPKKQIIHIGSLHLSLYKTR